MRSGRKVSQKKKHRTKNLKEAILTKQKPNTNHFSRMGMCTLGVSGDLFGNCFGEIFGGDLGGGIFGGDFLYYIVFIIIVVKHLQ